MHSVRDHQISCSLLQVGKFDRSAIAKAMLFLQLSSDIFLLQAILDKCDGLSAICEDGDVQIVDRGFRDVAVVFEEMGYDVKMPGFLDKNAKQFTSEAANETRLVTKCRWVVENFHARFKKWRMFSERIDQSFILNIATLTRTLAACLNKHRPVLNDANSSEHEAIAQRMLQARHRISEIKQLISSDKLSMRKKWAALIDLDSDLNFPRLTLEFLREYTCGTNQIKQSKAYAKAHLYENDEEFALELSPSDDNLLRCRVHSRHSNSTKYHLCVRFDENDNDDPIKDHYCQCKSGARMIGCCGHVATVLWYLSYARHFGWKPPTRTDQFRNKIIEC